MTAKNTETKTEETAPGIGHNSAKPSDVGGIAGERLNSFVERIERLNEEKKTLQEDIGEVFAELKGVGFEPKIVRKIIAIRKMDLDKRREEEELTDLYMAAMGIQLHLH